FHRRERLPLPQMDRSAHVACTLVRTLPIESFPPLPAPVSFLPPSRSLGPLSPIYMHESPWSRSRCQAIPPTPSTSFQQPPLPPREPLPTHSAKPPPPDFPSSPLPLPEISSRPP